MSVKISKDIFKDIQFSTEILNSKNLGHAGKATVAANAKTEKEKSAAGLVKATAKKAPAKKLTAAASKAAKELVSAHTTGRFKKDTAPLGKPKGQSPAQHQRKVAKDNAVKKEVGDFLTAFEERSKLPANAKGHVLTEGRVAHGLAIIKPFKNPKLTFTDVIATGKNDIANAAGNVMRYMEMCKENPETANLEYLAEAKTAMAGLLKAMNQDPLVPAETKQMLAAKFEKLSDNNLNQTAVA